MDDGNDVEAGNSKRTAAGYLKGQKRKRTIKDRLALCHEQTTKENRGEHSKKTRDGGTDRQKQEAERQRAELPYRVRQHRADRKLESFKQSLRGSVKN